MTVSLRGGELLCLFPPASLWHHTTHSRRPRVSEGTREQVNEGVSSRSLAERGVAAFPRRPGFRVTAALDSLLCPWVKWLKTAPV